MKPFLVILAFGLADFEDARAEVKSFDLFIATKTMSPQNSLVFIAQVDNCALTRRAPVTVKWIRRHEGYRRDTLKSYEWPLVRPIISYQTATELDFTFKVMQNYVHLLPDDRIKVRLEDCVPKAFFNTPKEEVQFLSLHSVIRSKNGVIPEPAHMEVRVKDKRGQIYTIRIDN